VKNRPSDTPWGALTRYFFQTLFRLRFLDDAGEESFTRAIIGVLVGIFALGLFVSRLQMGKYARLVAQPSADVYRSMIAADQLLAIVLPMWTTALVMACVSHAVFPDDLDFRTLTPLPLSRRTIFSAKIAAVFAFATIFSVGANLSFGLPLLASGGRLPGLSLGVRAMAQLTSGALGSAFVVASFVALQGLVLVLTPRAWLRKVSLGVQTAVICALVLSIPLVARVPALWRPLQANASWLFLVPPAWFLGAEQWALGGGDAYFARLAVSAAGGTSAVVLVGAVCYLAVYRRFDRTVLDSERGRPPSRWNVRLSMPVARHPATEAVRMFTAATLRRSGLHQLVCLGIFAAGFSLAANSLLGAIGLSERGLVRAAIGMPLTLMAGTVVGLRTALLLPTNLRAGWIFRLTEDAAIRPHQMNAVRLVRCPLGSPGGAPYLSTADLGAPSAGVRGLSARRAPDPPSGLTRRQTSPH
jgi:hypothetical protein